MGRSINTLGHKFRWQEQYWHSRNWRAINSRYFALIFFSKSVTVNSHTSLVNTNSMGFLQYRYPFQLLALLQADEMSFAHSIPLFAKKVQDLHWTPAPKSLAPEKYVIGKWNCDRFEYRVRWTALRTMFCLAAWNSTFYQIVSHQQLILPCIVLTM